MVHEFIDLETGETVYVEMTQEQYMAWLDAWVKAMGDLEILSE
jgi:hypothetical protein